MYQPSLTNRKLKDSHTYVFCKIIVFYLCPFMPLLFCKENNTKTSVYITNSFKIHRNSISIVNYTLFLWIHIGRRKVVDWLMHACLFFQNNCQWYVREMPSVKYHTTYKPFAYVERNENEKGEGKEEEIHNVQFQILGFSRFCYVLFCRPLIMNISIAGTIDILKIT